MNPRALPYERPSRGYTPPAPPQFWRVLIGIVMWCLILTSLLAIAFPLRRAVVAHVKG